MYRQIHVTTEYNLRWIIYFLIQHAITDEDGDCKPNWHLPSIQRGFPWHHAMGKFLTTSYNVMVCTEVTIGLICIVYRVWKLVQSLYGYCLGQFSRCKRKSSKATQVPIPKVRTFVSCLALEETFAQALARLSVMETANEAHAKG